MVGLYKLQEAGADDATAKMILEQVVDNALVTAGIMDDARSMVSRVNGLVELLLKERVDEAESAAAEK
jgi:hypothetical protein